MDPNEISREIAELRNRMAAVQERIDFWSVNAKNPVVLQQLSDDYTKLATLQDRIYALAEMENPA